MKVPPAATCDTTVSDRPNPTMPMPAPLHEQQREDDA